MRVLPKGWTTTTLGNVASLVYGKNLPTKTFINEGFDVFGANGIIGKHSEYIYEEPQVLISCRGAYSGKINLSPPKAFVTNNSIVCEFFDTRLCYTKYYFYMLQNTDRTRIVSGSAQPQVTSKDAVNLAIAIAPLNEQKRIVEKIEELFSQIDAGEAALKKAQALIKQYRQSLLKAAITGELTKEWREKNKSKIEPAGKLLARILSERRKAFNGRGQYKEPITLDINHLPKPPAEWGWCSVDHIAAFHRHAIKAGPFGSALKKDMYTSGGYKIYGQEQVISGDWNYGDYFINEEKYLELANCSVEPNDILISLVGTVGKVLILPKEAKKGIINPRLIKISPNLSVYNPLLFKYYFESYFLKRLYSSETHGATMDVLNLGIIRSLPFPLCSLAEQNEIVNILEEKFSVLDALQTNYALDMARHSSLRQSILKAAFSGQLVPQDPKDEPASVLLERIKAERDGTNNKSTKRTAKQQQPAATRARKRVSK